MPDIETKIRAILVEKTGEEESEITLETHFANDLGIGSLDMIEVIMELEWEFNIDIEDKDVKKLATVADAIAYIESK